MRCFKRYGISQVGYVPDTGHTQLISLCQEDNEITDVVLTSEAEGRRPRAGRHARRQRAALLMQSSGVGNCINTFSMLRNCAVPCVILVTMRGEFDDFNPWQVPMGSITERDAQACGFLTYRVEREEDIEEVVAAGCNMAFGGAISRSRSCCRSAWSIATSGGHTDDGPPSHSSPGLLADRGDLHGGHRARLVDLSTSRPAAIIR